jgi:hypothetical protein
MERFDALEQKFSQVDDSLRISRIPMCPTQSRDTFGELIVPSAPQPLTEAHQADAPDLAD